MIGVYAGRFDPATNGHVDIACRAARLFEELVLAVYDLPPERCLFSTEERVAMLKASMPNDVPISVERFSGLLTDFMRCRGASTIVRGLRAVTDFSAVFDLALMYKDLAPELEQIYLMTDLRYIFLSASRIREVAALGHDVSRLVPAPVAEQLRRRFASR